MRHLKNHINQTCNLLLCGSTQTCQNLPVMRLSCMLTRSRTRCRFKNPILKLLNMKKVKPFAISWNHSIGSFWSLKNNDKGMTNTGNFSNSKKCCGIKMSQTSKNKNKSPKTLNGFHCAFLERNWSSHCCDKLSRNKYWKQTVFFFEKFENQYKIFSSHEKQDWAVFNES